MVNSLSREGIISDEEKEIVRFGLESLEGNLLGIILVLTIGNCFRRIEEALALWLLLFPLRKNAGGYHADTKIKCFLMSAAMLIVAFFLFAVNEHTMFVYGICAVTAGCVIWVLAPVGNSSKSLDVLEHRVYRKRTRIVLGAEMIIFVLASCFEYKMAIKSVCAAMFIVSISLVLGKMKLSIRNKFNG